MKKNHLPVHSPPISVSPASQSHLKVVVPVGAQCLSKPQFLEVHT